MLTFFEAVILGIIEGVTEFLPVSSTAHLILTSNILGLPQSDYLKSFEIAIQSGAILAVVFLYWRALLKPDVLKRLIVAFIPTGIIGLVAYKIVKEYLLGSISTVAWSLLIGGVLLILFEKLFTPKAREDKSELQNITYLNCLILGLFQSVAMIPGVSRAAATIVGGMLLGIQRKTIVEFSFLLAVPTMFAATGLDLVKSAGTFSSSDFIVLLVGFLTSFIMAAISIRWLMSYIKKHDFTWFGIYRVAVAILFLI